MQQKRSEGIPISTQIADEIDNDPGLQEVNLRLAREAARKVGMSDELFRKYTGHPLNPETGR